MSWAMSLPSSTDLPTPVGPMTGRVAAHRGHSIAAAVFVPWRITPGNHSSAFHDRRRRRQPPGMDRRMSRQLVVPDTPRQHDQQLANTHPKRPEQQRRSASVQPRSATCPQPELYSGASLVRSAASTLAMRARCRSVGSRRPNPHAGEDGPPPGGRSAARCSPSSWPRSPYQSAMPPRRRCRRRGVVRDRQRYPSSTKYDLSTVASASVAAARAPSTVRTGGNGSSTRSCRCRCWLSDEQRSSPPRGSRRATAASSAASRWIRRST